ncbi:DUF6304 family protein [Streptomyces sp. NPDC058657]|uniref:DUF6304 family protein n=1 Tax=unclassified Streptomyces TaxID=2593676 RepID=UPI0036677ADD
MTGESWVGWYRDRTGTQALAISTDGHLLRARIRDVEFTGTSFDALLPTAEPPPDEAGFTLSAEGALCGCVLEWDIPMPVYDAGTVHRAALRCLLTLGRPDPAGGPGPDRLHLGLALYFDGAQYESGLAASGFAAALADIQRQLSPGSYLKSCLSCAFSDYSPATATPLFGGLGCFRDAKDAYRAAEGAEGVALLWDRRAGSVQETHRCPDFERRPDGATGTGHRGPFPPPAAALIHVQGDFRPPQPVAPTG